MSQDTLENEENLINIHSREKWSPVILTDLLVYVGPRAQAFRYQWNSLLFFVNKKHNIAIVVTIRTFELNDLHHFPTVNLSIRN